MAAMAAPPEFCLRWNNYHESLAGAFSGFLEREDFLDVSLACDDAVISAHKCILSACSPFFQEILLKNPCQHPTIVLPSGVQAAHVHRLVSFIYRGEVNVPHHLLPELIKTADLLKIRGLASESIIPVQMPPQPLEVQAVITMPEPGPPDLSAPPPAAPPPQPPPAQRRKRSRRDASDASPPPPELTAAEPPPPPPLCRGGGAEPPGGAYPPQHPYPHHHHQHHHQQPPPPPHAVDHRTAPPELAGAGRVPAGALAAAPMRVDPGEIKREPTAGERAEPPEPGLEPCRSPIQHLATIDGLDLLDPSQLLGYDGSAGGPSTHRPCPVCNRIMRKRDISRHMQRVHSVRKHACSHCPLSYGYRLDLRRHLIEKHATLAGRDSPLSAGGSPHRADADGSDYDERSDSNE